MSNRNLRRLAKKTKPPTELSQALAGLVALSGDLKKAIPEAGQDLAAAKDILREWREMVADLQYQIERQRAVFLRMFRDIGIMSDWGPYAPDAVPPIQFDSGERIGSYTWTDLEARYGAEYDAMQFLCRVVMLGGEDT